ncbi:MAG: DNA-binding domain-containing protein [Pseudomonadota bacterium]|nr:DNA-binding domain-containing protein [Pseudomonadota bacterium]
MKRWSEELEYFAQAIISGQGVPDNLASHYGHYDLTTAMAIYRNNYRGNLHDALAGAYPVVLQLVGDEFFRLMTHHFINQTPSHSGNLHHYGAAMAAFIADFAPAAGLPYLADVAALEWGCHCAYFAKESPLFDLKKLAQVAAEKHADLRLVVNPAATLLHSKYPVADLWRAHQPNSNRDFQIDISSGGCIALVVRVQGVVDVCELSAAQSDWLLQLSDGTPLGSASEATLARYPQLDLAATLLELVAKNVLTTFTLGA